MKEWFSFLKILKVKYFAIDMVLDEYDLTKDKEAGYISQRNFKKANEIISGKFLALLLLSSIFERESKKSIS